MILKENKFEQPIIFEPKLYHDNRGYFLEIFRQSQFAILKKKFKFVQDNYSFSKKGVLRGLHFQKKKSQGKLLSVISGSIYDVVVDIRKKSKNFGKWQGFYLSGRKHSQIWIPPGFAHGFLSLENNSRVIYKCTEYYDPLLEEGILWNDSFLNIKWPKNIKLIISNKDKNLNRFNDLLKLNKFY